MKWAAIILLVLGSAIFLWLGYYLFLGQIKQDTGAVPTTPTNPFGFSVSTTSSSGTLVVSGTDGASYAVPDFTKQDQPVWANESTGYQVAGSDDGDFLIVYTAPDSFGNPAQFLVSLQVEPLGETRLAAEAELKNRLKLSTEDLCALDIQVWTGIEINEAYAGRDLGLSFCPDATVLP